MVSTPKRSSGAGSTFMAWVFIAGVAGVVLAAINWGQAWMPVKGSKVSWNPIELIKYATAGQFHWSVGSTILLIALVIGGMLVLTFGYYFLIAPLLGRGKESSSNPGSGVVSREMGFKPAVKMARRDLSRVLPDGTPDTAVVTRVASTSATFKQGLFAQWQDTMWVFAQARMGKTRKLLAQAVLEAPGPVYATGTKPDFVMYTAIARSQVGTVQVYDLEGISGWPDQLRWNPLDGCQDQEEAMNRAAAWAAAAPMQGVTKSDWFSGKAAAVLGRLMHAAALGGKDMSDVLAWAEDETIPEPVQILNAAGYTPVFTGALTSRARSRAGTTEDSIKSTLTGLLEPLATERVLSQFKVPRGHGFNVHDFLAGQNTVYVLLKSSTSRLAPLVSMFGDFVFRTAQDVAATRPSNRLWPPLAMELDEAPTMGALPQMGEVMTDSGGRGIRVRGYSQSFSRNVTRWGADVAKEIADNANSVLLLPGLDSEDVAKYAKEMGVIQVQRTSRSSSRNGDSTSISMEEKPVMRPEELTQLPEGQALLRYRNLPPAIVFLPDLSQRKDARALEEQSRQAEQLAGKWKGALQA